MPKVSHVLFSAIVLLVLLAASWWMLNEPTSVHELLPGDASIAIDDYQGSMAPEENVPSVMILGTPHFAQMDHDFEQNEFKRVVETLSGYDPDLVAVEYLPPDYPKGKGRDYRPDFDVGAYAEKWSMSTTLADSLIAENLQGADVSPCQLGNAYFVTRDFVNAPYYWKQEECTQHRKHAEIANWLERREEHEMARIGYTLAEEHDIEELVSIDYQGEDTEWFIFDTGIEALRSGRLWAIASFWPVLPRVGVTSREVDAHRAEHRHDLASYLRFWNSPDWAALQYWAYEEIYPSVRWDDDDIGSRQSANYWLRNEYMFEYLQKAIDKKEAERALIIVGAGHKYFLDELARQHGYRWIDPREWLPAGG